MATRNAVKKRARDRKYSYTARGGYRSGKSTAKKRGLFWDLGFEEYEQIRNKPCYYCGDQSPQTGAGLDRIDNRFGYVASNVIPCCGSCNEIKGRGLSVEEMKFIMSQLKKFRSGEIGE